MAGPSKDFIKSELSKCSVSAAYFIDSYIPIYDGSKRSWIPFKLWAQQFRVLRQLSAHRQIVILKARQLGLTWLILGWALWYMLFRPKATILIFSRRDMDAIYLLDERMKGMYQGLPEWMQASKVSPDSGHVWGLSNGSVARAFPTSAGDSYTATLALVDEADLVPDLGRLLRAVKPTIDGGGQIILLSRADKDEPKSEFKETYKAGKVPDSEWHSIFLPWHAREDRTPAWYQAIKREIFERTGSLDELHEQYPATDEEALSPKSKSKRVPHQWLRERYQELRPIVVGDDLSRRVPGLPDVPGLRIFKAPEPDKEYVAGVDTCEGNPNSDPSAITVLDKDTGEEVATLNAPYEPSVLGGNVAKVCRFWRAPALVERNNHGHAVLLWIRDNAQDVTLLSADEALNISRGPSKRRKREEKPGFVATSRSNEWLFDTLVESIRDDDLLLHDEETYLQIGNIEAATLKAPSSEHDDLARSASLANVARILKVPGGGGWSGVGW